MTNKELLYVEDALGHEKFMKCCAKKTSEKLTDPELTACMNDLEKKHCELLEKFKNLL